MLLAALYHWAPSERYDSIRARGLVAGSLPAVASVALHTVCLGPDPQQAWALSGAMEWLADVDEWDLWQVVLGPNDEVMIRAEFGPQIYEVKVRNSIPPDRLWFVGRRGCSGGECGPQAVTAPSEKVTPSRRRRQTAAAIG